MIAIIIFTIIYWVMTGLLSPNGLSTEEYARDRLVVLMIYLVGSGLIIWG
jgi:hypothetical protein